MKTVFEEYGRMILSIVVTLVVMAILLTGAYVGTNVGMEGGTTHTSNGIMNAMGHEAAKTDIAEKAREDIVQDAPEDEKNILHQCQNIISKEETVELTELFEAKREDESAVPVILVQIRDKDAKGVLNTAIVSYEENRLTFYEAGDYQVTVKTPSGVKKIFVLHVLDEVDEQEEGEML